MGFQPTTQKIEAGHQPASLSSNTSATALILMGGAFIGTMFVGLTELLLSGHTSKEAKRFALIIGPGLSQLITAGALYAYKQSARRKFQAFVEGKMRDLDLKIALLPKKTTSTSLKKLEEFEGKRKQWEELLDSNQRAYIDAD